MREPLACSRGHSCDEGGVAEMVGSHRPLEALRGQLQRSAHDPGVADQRREMVVAAQQRLRAASDLVKVGQVELHNAGRSGPLQARRGRLPFGGVAHSHHDVTAACDKFPGRFQPDSAVGAGHDERAPGPLGDLRRPPAHSPTGATVTAILPRTCPASRRRIAAGTSASG